ncbi:MAG TPA: ABC transporter permease, partial [Longimicrobiaceae bacterium]|nr:ABC transporter permease [Longimicrobiaceae bacterium]
RFHLEMLTEELVAAGVPPAEAAARARARFGDVGRIRDACRRIGEAGEARRRRLRAWADLGQDLRYGARQLRRTPVLAAVAVATLALGIGANTALFSAVDAVLLRPLPYRNAERVVAVSESWRGTPGRVAPGLFVDWRAQARSFAALAAFEGGSFNLSGGATPERLYGARVSPAYFAVAGLPPALGRYFLPHEERPGAGDVVVLSHALWATRFGADPGVAGRAVLLNGRPYTVVGVAPPELTLTPDDEALWVPLTLTAAERAKFDGHHLQVFGRLRPGVSPARAQAELARVTAEAARRHPVELVDRTARVAPLREALVGGFRRRLLLLLAAVGSVLLIACGNVASLLLARAAARRRETAIRTALGASRGRLVRQFLAESLVLALAGGALGLLVARAGLGVLRALAPAAVPMLHQARLDPRVLAFALGLSLVCALGFGLAPALYAALPAAGPLRSAAVGPRHDRFRRALVAAEVAVALTLLAGTGLLVRSALALAAVPPGFEPRGLLTLRLALPADEYRQPEAVARAFSAVVQRVGALPGVTVAGAVNQLPLGGESTDVGLAVEGRSFAAGEAPVAHLRLATPGYLEAMRIPLRRGRAPTARDGAGSPPVVVINEALARRLWPGEDPLGKRLACCKGAGTTLWREVVGVAGDVRHFGLDASALPELYVPHAQAPAESWTWMDRSMTVVARSSAPPEALAAAARRAVLALDPDLPVYGVRTMEQVMARSTAATRFSLRLFAGLGALGLGLAMIGLYGSLAYFVSQRKQEIGVRLALGAGTGRVLALVVRQGLGTALAGVGIGLLTAPALTRALSSLLYGVRPADPLTLAAVGVLVLLTAALASYLPARKAARVDPMVSLRYD